MSQQNQISVNISQNELQEIKNAINVLISKKNADLECKFLSNVRFHSHFSLLFKFNC